MGEKMVHYVAGPADGETMVIPEELHPAVASANWDTDGFYVMEYLVAGQRLGELELTEDDVIARWHQRSSETDFTTGDVVIIKATGERGRVFGPLEFVNDEGTTHGWLVQFASNGRFLTAEDLRVARPDEL